jgi:hypothetical protein
MVLFVLLFIPVLGFSQPQNNDEQLAIQYFTNREYEKAAMIFSNLYEKRPDAYYYVYYLQSLLELQKYDDAEKLVKKHRKKNSMARYSVDLGYVYELSNQSDKAKKEYDKAIKDLPAEQFQITDLANAFLSRRHPELAIETYQYGRKVLNNPYIFSIEIAQMYQTSGNMELMMQEYLRLIEQNPGNVEDIQLRLQGVFTDDENNSKYEIIRKSILKQTQKQPENMGFAVLMYWLSLQKQDFEMAMIQAKAIDKRFNKTDHQLYEFAKVSLDNQHWDIAIQAYQYIIDKGEKADYYLVARIELLDAKYQQLTSIYPLQIAKISELDQQFSALITELEFNPQVVPFIRTEAKIKAYYLNQIGVAEKLLDSAIKIPGILPKDQALCKLDLADIKLFNNNIWDATLLYSQVEKDYPNDTLGHEAKFRNAKLSFYIGEFEWSKAQLDVLRSATSKLIANDAMQLYMLISDNEDEDSTNIALKHYADADLFFYRKQNKQAVQCLDSIGMLSLEHPLADEVLFKKAQISISLGKYSDADSLLSKICNYYSEDILADDACFLDAEINQKYLNNKEKATTQYQKIITNYPSSVYINEARKRFRLLRGDHIN